MFRLEFGPKAARALSRISQRRDANPETAKRLAEALDRLEADPRDPKLHSHPFFDAKGEFGAKGVKRWTSYVEKRARGAWRIIWRYGPDDGVITVIWIGPHY